MWASASGLGAITAPWRKKIACVEGNGCTYNFSRSFAVQTAQDMDPATIEQSLAVGCSFLPGQYTLFQKYIINEPYAGYFHRHG